MTGMDAQRCRYALSWLIDQDGVAQLGTWATHIAAWEEDTALVQVPEERRMHLYSWLYFVLVPRLVREGLLEYEPDRVRPVSDIEKIGEYLVALSTDDDSTDENDSTDDDSTDDA